jgi:DNA-binding LacI/PurR family transcriptional regulator
MGHWHRASSAKQLAEYLRGEVIRGQWHEKIPGVMRLAGELGVSRDTVEAALIELEREGLLLAQGRGKRRILAADGRGSRPQALRVSVLLLETADRSIHYVVELMHALREAGHEAEFAPKTQIELGGKVARLARMVGDTPADAWLVFAGSSEVLEWFAASSLHTFAIFGRANQLPIASIAPDKVTPMRLAVRRLVALGHHRIALLTRPRRVFPEPGRFEREFLNELEAQGIATGPYHLPTWDETAEGFHNALDALFRYTPPTALFIDEAPPVTAALQFCMKRGLRIPEDVSLICTDSDLAFEWCQPTVAHIYWDSRHIIRTIVRWTENIRNGREDRQKGFFKARFIEGGTIGPAKPLVDGR